MANRTGEQTADLWSNTAKDGSGTNLQPLLDSDGHFQVDVLSGGTSAPGTAFNEFGEDAAVVSSTETTLASYTVPAGKTAHIQGFYGNGSASGRYKLKVDGTVKAVSRSSAASRNASAFFGWGTIEAAAGAVVIVTGFHEEVANQVMDANVFGFLT